MIDVEELTARLEAIEYALVVLLAGLPEAQTSALPAIVADLQQTIADRDRDNLDTRGNDGTRWPIKHRSLPYLEDYADRAVALSAALRAQPIWPPR